jgi:hypothetical protein
LRIDQQREVRDLCFGVFQPHLMLNQPYKKPQGKPRLGEHGWASPAKFRHTFRIQKQQQKKKKRKAKS